MRKHPLVFWLIVLNCAAVSVPTLMAGPIGEKRQEADPGSLLRQGEAAMAKVDFSGALEAFDLGISSCQRNKSSPLLGTLLCSKAEALRRRGDLTNALAVAHLAEIARSVETPQRRAEARCVEAAVLLEQGEYTGAAALYQNCLPIFLNAHDWGMASLVLGSIGCLYEATGRLDASVRYQELSLKLGSQDPERAARAHLNLGNTYEAMADAGSSELGHNYAPAKSQFALCKSLASQIRDTVLQAKAIASSADVTLKSSQLTPADLEAARSQAESALRLTDGVDTLDAARIQGTLALILTETGEYENSKSILARILARFQQYGLKEEEWKTLHALGEICRRQGNIQKYARFEAQAAEVHRLLNRIVDAVPAPDPTPLWLVIEDTGWSNTVNSVLADLRMARVPESKKAASHKACLAEASSLAQDLPPKWAWLQRLAFDSQAVSAESETNWPLAAVSWERVAALVDRGAGGDSSWDVESELRGLDADVFTHWAFCLAKAGESDRVLLAAEEGRAWKLDRQLEFGAAFASNAPRTSTASSGAIQPTLSHRPSDISQTIADIEQRLDRPVPLVEYALGASNLTIALAVPNDAGTVTVRVVTELISRQAIIALLVRHKSLMNGESDSIEDPAQAERQLYDWLIEPVECYLPDHGPVGIIPDSVLWGVPFTAIQDTNGQYFCQRHAVFLAPSMTALQLLLERADARRLNPLLTSSNELVMVVGPHTELADQIPVLSNRLSGRFTCLDGPEADVVHIVQAIQNYRWIHFLSHGTYDSEDPMLCGLHIAPDRDLAAPGIDGFLGVDDIAGCHLTADSVVLCACDSANGRIQPGEGLVGLPSAFLVAGASSVVASQWRANTVAATRLMREYYARLPATLGTHRNLWNAEALAAAQSSFLADRPASNYHDPRYWASFVLIGDPR